MLRSILRLFALPRFDLAQEAHPRHRRHDRLVDPGDRSPVNGSPTLFTFFKGRLLGWFGILGLAQTIFSRFEDIVKFSDAAHFIVEKWHAITLSFWTYIVSFFGIELDRGLVPWLNSIFFLCSFWLGFYAQSKGTKGLDNQIDAWCRVLNPIFLTILMCSILLTGIDKLPPEIRGQSAGYRIVAFYLVLLFTFGGLFLDVDSKLLTRRLIDVLFVVSILLALNFVSLYAPGLRDWVGIG